MATILLDTSVIFDQLVAQTDSLRRNVGMKADVAGLKARSTLKPIGLSLIHI